MHSHKQRKIVRGNKTYKDGKYLFYIHQAMHESIVPRVVTTKTTKVAWNTLQTSYERLD